MSDEEWGYANHNDGEANNNSEQGKKYWAPLRWALRVRDIEEGEKIWVLLILLILASVYLDPLFFYISVINNDSNCLQSDNVLRITVVVLRTFADGAYLTLWWWRPMLASPSSRRSMLASPSSRRSMLASPSSRRTMLASPSSRRSSPKRTCLGVQIPGNVHFLMVVLAFLPLPQVLVYAVSWRLLTVKLLNLVVLFQFVPRMYLTFQTYKCARKFFRGIMNLSLAATFFFLMFTLAGNVLGAFWYLCGIERNMKCWKKACKTRGLCGVSSLYCHDSSSNNKYLDEFCPIPPAPNSTFFDYGIYLGAFQRNIMSIHTNFINKVFYCNWWGLLSLSSFGQNLDPGTYVEDNIFSSFITVSGLILFALLIGNMQERIIRMEKEKQERIIRMEKEKQKKMEKEKQEMRMGRMEWMEKEKQEKLKKEKQERMERIQRAFVDWPLSGSLPLRPRAAILSCKDEKWLGTTEINLQSLLNNIPVRLRNFTMRYLCEKLFSDVENFEQLHPFIKTTLRQGAKPVVFQARTIIHTEGYPIYEMIHIVSGKALSFKKDSNMNIVNDPIGEEVLDSCLKSSEPFLPLATETVMALTTVEAFTLSVDDFVSVFTRHGRLINEAYQKDWAARVITTALRQRCAMVRLQKDMETENRNKKMGQ